MIKNIKFGAPRGLFKDGTSFATHNPVKTKLTYKTLTLVFGIFVALIVAFTLWSNQKNSDQFPENAVAVPHTSVPNIQGFTKEVIYMIRFIRFQD